VVSQKYVHPTPEAMELAFERLNAANEKAMASLPGSPKLMLQETDTDTTTDTGEELETEESDKSFKINRAGVAELVDARDLKSLGPQGLCGFDSRPPHQSFLTVTRTSPDPFPPASTGLGHDFGKRHSILPTVVPRFSPSGGHTFWF
jgi:hypothetical protein